ncbi:MAG: PadR family transcriptional regulator [Candidatus Izemoplasmatales bacterium]|jgi:DNA-binding PadR family transcriptional regulator|nr:PadR family transcriptional regulator [Candidatus Izemoplasmatales bacterium]MDD4988229.1 PadR family transcriptional regulator [Candidatus Izemoplasmatales bacterium]MDD5601716.1 PadR family transcriptional regulator [Candidatus Izemoplasmatales bacterium]MDY0372560.1 PadR family transcriptional regulator [Candidatus Izemoplasmatales bacterium]NLF49285.1 PadR family transcriptional regulator [Acholeplasmataceae bacterium]
MTNSGEYVRGFTDYIILSILAKFDSYGYEMSKIIEQVSDEHFQLTEATLYFALKRLLEDGKISSYKEKNKKGMSRRYYQITSEGKQALHDFRKDWIQIENTLANLVGGTFEYLREE